MPRKKEYSDFMARELLLDFYEGHLDEVRKQALEETLRASEDLRDDLRALKEGLKYIDKLSESKISTRFFETVNEQKKSEQGLTARWRTLPAKYRLAIESSAILFVIILIVALIPQEYLPWKSDNHFYLSEVNRIKNTNDVEISESTPNTTIQAVESSERKQSEAIVEEPTNLTTTTMLLVNGNDKKTTPLPSPLPIATPSASPGGKVAAGKGEIYRLYMSSDNTEKLTPEVVQKILELGGVKAGEVQLGWMRKTGSYFHFSMPQSNYQSLTQYLQNFGPVRIVREPHVRVMPEGTVRLILWIERNGSENTDDDSSSERAD